MSTISQFFYSKAIESKSLKTSISQAVDLDQELEKSSVYKEPKSITNSILWNAHLFYIYTSGTTGLPKAVTITHIRQIFVMGAATELVNFKGRNDIIYSYLPLYHASGGQIGTSNSLIWGGTTVIKKKFSASTFWKDCIKYDITVINYNNNNKIFQLLICCC